VVLNRETQGRFVAGRILIMLNRGYYCQCADVIPKGGFEKKKTAGIAHKHCHR
jgi:hypothetical protein